MLLRDPGATAAAPPGASCWGGLTRVDTSSEGWLFVSENRKLFAEQRGPIHEGPTGEGWASGPRAPGSARSTRVAEPRSRALSRCEDGGEGASARTAGRPSPFSCEQEENGF